MLIRTIVPRSTRQRSLANHRAARFVPRVDVSETAEELRLTAELPGLEKSDFEVTVEEDVITIKGAKKLARAGEAPKRVAHAERCSGEFARSFRVPFEVDPESVAGRYRDGLLSLVVPKPSPTESTARTVPVTNG